MAREILGAGGCVVPEIVGAAFQSVEQAGAVTGPEEDIPHGELKPGALFPGCSALRRRDDPQALVPRGGHAWPLRSSSRAPRFRVLVVVLRGAR